MRAFTIGLVAALVLSASASRLHAGDDDQDIIRLLPPGPSTAPLPPDNPPSNPQLPFSPANLNPGSGAPRLKGKEIKLPLAIAASPSEPGVGYVGVRLDLVASQDLATALGVDTAPAVYVIDATAGAPAAQAGLRFGDVVLAVDGARVASVQDLVNAVRSKPGVTAQLTVWRVGEDATGYLQALRELGDKGNTAVMLFVARFYSAGIGVRRDQSEAVAWYKKAALAGSTNGMLMYGDAVATGNGAVKDLTEAITWIKKSAEAGNAAAYWRLGAMYRDGDGVPKDALEAMSLFKKAAEANYTPAMVAMGFMYEGGGGIEADHLQAVYWYKKAADAGDAEGMAVLGTKYYAGRGVERNYATAASWYTEGAKRGQLLAVHNLAVMYDKGLGVGKDPRMAAAYVYQALEQRYGFTYQQMVKNGRQWSREFRKELQRKLTEVGRYQGPIDGNFGRPTLDAIDAVGKPLNQ